MSYKTQSESDSPELDSQLPSSCAPQEESEEPKTDGDAMLEVGIDSESEGRGSARYRLPKWRV